MKRQIAPPAARQVEELGDQRERHPLQRITIGMRVNDESRAGVSPDFPHEVGAVHDGLVFAAWNTPAGTDVQHDTAMAGPLESGLEEFDAHPPAGARRRVRRHLQDADSFATAHQPTAIPIDTLSARSRSLAAS